MLQERIKLTPESTSPILLEIKQAFGGRVPNLFKAYAKYPPLLETNWKKVKEILLNGKLRRKVKEAIAAVISQDNGCKYCVAAHTAALRSMKVTEPQISAILQGLLPEDFTEKEAALIRFTRKANQNWHSISNADLKALFDLGIEDDELLEALGTMELFIAFNRFADVMGIEIDF
ncbi:MAG: alkyl hydroperoxide reductase AhpD [Nitrosomonas sp.]|nr:MAG: alkyl hydroperoxide reductase AhpD [Nitrosomonas sp.]